VGNLSSSPPTRSKHRWGILHPTHRKEVRLAYDWRPQLTDPGDEKVLDAAINGFADAIVTHNVRHFTPAQAHFGIAVVAPGIIMKERFR
jgi:predicted nucleic acid-binding protein